MNMSMNPGSQEKSDRPSSADKWYQRGKEARLHGEGRDKIDGRMTPANRRSFQLGWDDQNAAMKPPLTEEELDKRAAGFAALRAAIPR